MALFRKLFYRKPPDGLLEISERVYVFDCCFTMNAWEKEDYKGYASGIISQLRDQYPDASILVFNFHDGETPSQIASVLSEYDMTIMDYPRHYEGCPLLSMEVIHHFLRSSESWLSLGQQNVLLMHCDRGGWPVLAFMLAALLIYRRQYTGEHKTLDMVYKQAPRELLHLLSPLNPVPSQLRYLQYVSRRNVVSEWPPADRALTLDCVIIRMIPNFDGEGGCRPIIRIYGKDPLLVGDRTPKVLFSTPKRSKTIRHYNQVECELVKIDINCQIQGDVVLECINLHDENAMEQMIFRVMFNTAFIRSNILMLNRDEIEMVWDAKDQFPKDFRAEVLFSDIDAAASLLHVDLSCFEEKDGLPVEAFAKVQEMFNSVDWMVPKGDTALNLLQQITASNAVQESRDSDFHQRMDGVTLLNESTLQKHAEKESFNKKQSVSFPYPSPNTDVSEVKDKPQLHVSRTESNFPETQSQFPPSTPFTALASESIPYLPQQQVTSNHPAISKSMCTRVSEQGDTHSKESGCLTLVSTPHATKTASSSTIPPPPLPIIKRPTSTSPLPHRTIVPPLSSTPSSPPPLPCSTSQPPLSPLLPPNCTHPSSSPPSPTPPRYPTTKALPSPPPPPLTPQATKPPPPPTTTTKPPAPAPPPLQHPVAPPPPPLQTIKHSVAPPPPPLPTIKHSVAPPPPPLPTIESSMLPTSPLPTIKSPPLPTSPLPTIKSTPLQPPPSTDKPLFQTPPSIPPPPPTPPLKENSVFHIETPPPPPLLYSAKTEGPKVLSTPTPPPPVPSSSQNCPCIPSAPPPPIPSVKGGIEGGAGFLDPPSVGNDRNSNASGSPSPPPPSFPLTSTKGRSLSHTVTSKNHQTKKLKPLHWLKLTRAVQGSLWAEAQKSGEASKTPEIDISELESLFSAAIPNSDQRQTGRSNSRASLGTKPEKVQLVEHRRAYNCEIMLSKVKIPLPDLLSLVLALEESSLDGDQVDNLIKFCPTKEEMDLLKGYKGEKDKLGKCEQFFLELMQVPRVESKLRVFSFKIQFRSQVSDLRNSLNVVNSAADQLRSSAKLKRIMQTILSLGNALNQGTARGAAVGFRLDSLLKLTETRARNNKMTLMHYLCKVLADKLSELLDFSKDLSSLEPASKIQLKFLAEEMQAISKGLEKVVQELSMSENDGPVSQKFSKALKEFLCYAEGEVRNLASLYSGVGRNVDALIIYFGEDPSRCPFEQVVSTLFNFVRMFNRTHEENCKQLELERRKAEKETSNEKINKYNASQEDTGLKKNIK